MKCRRSRDFYTSITKALSSSANRKDVQKIHSLVIIIFDHENFHKSLFFSGKLISKYWQSKDPDFCLLLFRQNSQTENAYMWNTIIRAMNHNGLYAKALEFYEDMRELKVNPDRYTFPSVINVCRSRKDFGKGREVHDHVLWMGFGSDLYIGNAVIDMYSRCSELRSVREVLDGMPHLLYLSMCTLDFSIVNRL